NVTPNDTPNIDYKGVIMTERDYGQPMVKKMEQFTMHNVKLENQKTGYGFNYTVRPFYGNQLSVTGIKEPSFDLFVDRQLMEKTLNYPIVDNKVKLSLEPVRHQVDKKIMLS
ncbi:TPA: hypothetical protein ACJHMO_003693, partial [Enterococcus faecalis]